MQFTCFNFPHTCWMIMIHFYPYSSFKISNKLCVHYVLLLQMESHAHAALTDPPFKGLVLTSEKTPIWNGLYPLVPNEVNFAALFLHFIIWNQLPIRLSTLFPPSPPFLCGYFGGNNQKLHDSTNQIHTSSWVPFTECNLIWRILC
jgi:hypothetical protein